MICPPSSRRQHVDPRAVAQHGSRQMAVRLWMSALSSVVAASWLGLGASASAQDMQFGVDEAAPDAAAAPQVVAEAPPPPPPAQGPPSEQMTQALRLYDRGDYAQAAMLFRQVVDGETQDAEANQQRAHFGLGRALYHLQFYQSALAAFDEIAAAGSHHLYYDRTLEWLVQLASQLPEPAGITEKIGSFDVAKLEQFNTPQRKELYQQLLFLMGRYKYSQRDFEQAVQLLGRVETDSPYFVRAKFFEGITQVRMRRAQPAIRAFRNVIEGIEEGTLGDVQDESRMLNLARMSLARVYYSAANQTDPDSGDRVVDGRLLGNAVEMWNKVDQGSEYWLDALFEASWAFFLADEFARALGNVHTIDSPYFDNAYYPEALVLKAVTFFVNCQADNAEAMVQTFHDRFDPVQAELTEVLEKHQDNLQFFEFLKRVRRGQANLSPRIRGIVATALSDRTLLENVEYVGQLSAEEERLKVASEAFRNSSAGLRVLEDVVLAKTFAVDQTGDLARSRYDRLIRELQDLMNQVDTVDVEILRLRRDTLEQELQEQLASVARTGGGNVEVDEEHQVWPFDGEYWRDELGFYRQQVTNQCGR